MLYCKQTHTRWEQAACMHTQRDYPRFTVNKKAEAAIRRGHPWVYGEEVIQRPAAYENGGLGDVVTEKGVYLGTGCINDASKILIRLLSSNANDRFDEAFFARRVAYALDYRRRVMGTDFNNCRLIFGEADQFPGLTVDRFGDILVTETLSLAMEKRKEMLFRRIVENLRAGGDTIRAIYERNESPLRLKEGMQTGKGFFPMEGLETELDGHTRIFENGVLYDVDYINGQKTGFFLDQKYNRRAAASLARGMRVLDCFTHTGAFALNCARAGAAKVTAVDISQAAIEETAANARLNGLELELVCRDVFELLTELGEKKSRAYDYIILDPPAFTKSSDTRKNVYRGYKEINRRAMQLLPRGGYLATCSCSHFMYEEDFKRMLLEAAADAHVTLRQIEARQQGPDHPILPTVPETSYLKFYLFQVI